MCERTARDSWWLTNIAGRECEGFLLIGLQDGGAAVSVEVSRLPGVALRSKTFGFCLVILHQRCLEPFGFFWLFTAQSEYIKGFVLLA